MSTNFSPFARWEHSRMAAGFAGRGARWRRRRDAQLGAAIQAIQRLGPAVTLREILEQMDLGPGELDEFFGGEGGLQWAIADYAGSSLVVRLMPVPTRRSTIDALAASLASRYLRWLRRHQALAEYSVRHFGYPDGPLELLRGDVRHAGLALLQRVLGPHELPGGELWALTEEIIDVSALHGARLLREGPTLPPLPAPFSRPDARAAALAAEISALIVKRGRTCGVRIEPGERLGAA